MTDLPPGFTPAAPWSLFAGALGKGSVIAAIVFFALAVLLTGLRKERLDRTASIAFVLGGLSLFAAFATLATLFVKDQFQYQYVWAHSDATTTLPYKIASVWTAQEGSFLLWASAAALFGLLALPGTGPFRRGFVGTTSLFLGTLGGILAYETPFKLIPELTVHGKTFVPPTGNGMVPLLQNYWVIIHPPTVFLGFGTLSLFAAYAAAAMLRGNVGDWAARVRPWALLSTAILGVGIVMGGLWAYETQGWGGFWQWDPVENVSFVPWLFVVTFVHGIIVQTARGRWKRANLWLGALPFLTFVYGTFLTRSGLLDKVSNHSFASMDKSARLILLIFLIVSVVAYTSLWAFRAARSVRADQEAEGTSNSQEESGIHREGLYRSGMTLLGLMATVIALGMSWPAVTALRGGAGSAIKEPVYHLVVTWFFLPLMILMGITPFVSWKKMEGTVLRERLFGVACVSIGLTGVLHLILLSTPLGVHPEAGATVAGPFNLRVPLTLWMLVLLFCVTFVVVANVWRVAELVRRSALGTGGFVAHLGFALLLGGLILSRGYERTLRFTVRPGSPDTVEGFTVAYRGATTADFRDRERKLEFEVSTPQGEKIMMRPGHYEYGREEVKDQVWPAIEHFGTHDLYLFTSPPQVSVTEKPVQLKPGGSRQIGDSTILLEYLAPTDNGKFGGIGAEFGAKLRLTVTDLKTDERKQYLASPVLTLTEEGLRPSLEKIGPDFMVALGSRIDPKTRQVDIHLLFNPPIYSVELFEKPYTSLVWAGTGIMFLGGLMSAYARRRVVARQRRTLPLNDAPFPAPQS